MSRGTNNFTLPPVDGRGGHHQHGFRSYAPYDNTDWNYTSAVPIFPRFSSSNPTLQDRRRGAFDPWRATEETIVTAPFTGFPVQPQSPMQLLLLNGMSTESAPRLLEQRNFPAYTSAQEESRLSQDEQMKAVKKLKKEIYNPVLKRLSRRLCLYYRDQAAIIANEREREKEEDGKRCAVCLEDFEPKEMVMLTPCNHMFHEECIVPWVKSQGQCPVCRFSLCDRTTGPRAGTLNNNNNLAPNNDQLSADLIAILRAIGAI